MKFLKKEKGFTLIELLVVISIIGVLASVVLTSLGNIREEARQAALFVEIRDFQTALELYNIDNGHYPHRENGLTFHNADVKYGFYLSDPSNDIWHWSEFRAKMNPYYDMDRFEDVWRKLGGIYYFHYYPVRYPSCSNGANVGENFQKYTLIFMRAARYPEVDRFYGNTSGNYDRHCIHKNQD